MSVGMGSGRYLVLGHRASLPKECSRLFNNQKMLNPHTANASIQKTVLFPQRYDLTLIGIRNA